MKIYEDKMKCMACSLHFIIYSDMLPDRPSTSVFCPECGAQGNVLRLNHVVHEDKFIFQFVSA